MKNRPRWVHSEILGYKDESEVRGLVTPCQEFFRWWTCMHVSLKVAVVLFTNSVVGGLIFPTPDGRVIFLSNDRHRPLTKMVNSEGAPRTMLLIVIPL
jgi:hypothetical protein